MFAALIQRILSSVIMDLLTKWGIMVAKKVAWKKQEKIAEENSKEYTDALKKGDEQERRKNAKNLLNGVDN